MLNPSLKKNALAVTVLLLLFIFQSAPFTSYNHLTKAPLGAVLETPCPQQKAAQAAQKLCQSYNHLQFSILPLQMFSFASLSEKMRFIFIFALLTMSPVYLSFKPPKPFFHF